MELSYHCLQIFATPRENARLSQLAFQKDIFFLVKQAPNRVKTPLLPDQFLIGVMSRALERYSHNFTILLENEDILN